MKPILRAENLVLGTAINYVYRKREYIEKINNVIQNFYYVVQVYTTFSEKNTKISKVSTKLNFK